MKIIIISDTHGNFNGLKKVVETEEPFNRLVHLGDGLEDGFRLKKIKDFNFDGVNGNNDPAGLFPDSLFLKLDKFNCFFTHGHLFRVNCGLQQVLAEGKKGRVSHIFFGHTHRAFEGFSKKIHILNPGAACPYLSKTPTYLVWETTEDVFYFKNIGAV